MKKLHIIGIVIIAVAIGVIFMSLTDNNRYADFKKAMENPDEECHLVGKLDKSQPQVYDPQVNADLFTFTLTDKEGVSMPVVLHKSKPQDFEKSEQVVVIGKMRGKEFHANDILMKCPSKYQDGKAQAQI